MPSELSTVQFLSWVSAALPYFAGVLLLGYLIVGGVLDYHWRRYGVGIIKITQLRATYVGGGIVLFGVLFLSMIEIL